MKLTIQDSVVQKSSSTVLFQKPVSDRNKSFNSLFKALKKGLSRKY